MKPDDIDILFRGLQTDFDINLPAENHEKRFLVKLNEQSEIKKSAPKVRKLWLPIIGIAASIILLVSVFTVNTTSTNINGLGSVSPEMAKTEDFFTVTITAELKKLQTASNPKTTLLINDGLKQLKRLETEYETLKTDLTESGNDQRVIYAMISNFQNRIEVLENTLEQIEHIKELNNQVFQNIL
ncbi:hypothetical protein BZARG_3001 [Bizionia argentinensis JUB59]|uniref:DUF4179 domain-containing protein n=1 Tax=Bizionia argentinensis JUB59 TaxID=1046627 RepID=G2EFL1_9FLAO|nr:hypothetical protein [Bizionia argentinensis]EGV42787.1 hypothetical protein BZARG_3001 [Bizionia argentinensis JUB59]